MKQIFIIIISIFCNGVQFCQAQDNIKYLNGNYSFTNYGVAQGLVGICVVKIFQDSKGYLWIGTHEGVSKFDGKNFTNYTWKDGLASNSVYGITEDTLGNMWFATMNGLNRFDGKRFFNYGKQKGISSSQFWDVILTHKKELWLASSAGLYKVKIKNIEKDEIQLENIFFKQLDKRDNIIRRIAEDQNENLWLGTETGLLKYNVPSGKVEKIKEIPQLINGLCVDKENNLWTGGWGGAPEIFKYKNGTSKTMVNAGSSLNAFLADSRGNIWAGTWDRGLLKFNGKEWTIYTTKNGLPINSIWSLFEDKEGNIWIGTFGSGLCKFSGEKFIHFTEANGLVNNVVMGIIQDKKNNIWFSTEEGISCFNPALVSLSENGFFNYTKYADGTRMTKITSVCMDSTGALWFTSYNGSPGGKYENEKFQRMSLGGWSSFIDKDGAFWRAGDSPPYKFYKNKETGFPVKKKLKDVNRILCIFQDTKSNMWFGSMGGGVNIYNGDTIINYSKQEGFTDKPVTSVLQDGVGNFWISTMREGVLKCSFSNNKIKTLDSLTMNDGLSSDEISFLILDKKQDLWIGTNKGINKFSLKEYLHTGKKNVKTYGLADGLKSVECNGGVCLDNNENIWFGTSEGAVCFNPNDILLKKITPDIHITDVKLSLEKVNWGNFSAEVNKQNGLPFNPELSYKDNHLTFEFTGISFTSPEKIQYSYLLEGSGSEWSHPMKETKVTFANLAPGTYSFKVKALNGEGIWSKTSAVFSFVITPPWWQTKTFYFLSITVLILGIVIFIRFRERKLQKEKAVLEEKVKERTVVIQQQKDEIEQQKAIVEEKNKDITDSINYAKRIQQAKLPNKEEIYSALPNCFVLFKPKDIVSGDFYFFYKNEQSVIIASADCTGHGVPGAFMSIIGSEKLDDAIAHNSEPADILRHLNKGIKNSLRQSESNESTRDGMDIALCRLEFGVQSSENKVWSAALPTPNSQLSTILQFAGANRPLWIIRRENKAVEEIKPNKTAIGGFTVDEYSFQQHEIYLEQGDTFYLFTDGYADQFGGSEGKKFTTKRLKELLLSIQDKNMQEQQTILEKTFAEWQEELGQVDDVLIIGVRI